MVVRVAVIFDVPLPSARQVIWTWWGFGTVDLLVSSGGLPQGKATPQNYGLAVTVSSTPSSPIAAAGMGSNPLHHGHLANRSAEAAQQMPGRAVPRLLNCAGTTVAHPPMLGGARYMVGVVHGEPVGTGT